MLGGARDDEVPGDLAGVVDGLPDGDAGGTQAAP